MNNDYNPNNFNVPNGDYNATMSVDSTPQEPTNNFTENAAQPEQPNLGGGFCNNCGNKIQPGEKFCTKCGTNLVQAENLRCEQCGAPVIAGTNFCNACGAPVNKTQKMFCQFCGEKYEEGEMFCKNCGNKITKSDGFFGGFTSTNANSSTAASALPIKKMSTPVKTLSFVAIGLVVLMFIFAFLPAFSLKLNLDVDKDKLSKEERKVIEKTLDEANEELNEEFEMNIFHPYEMFAENDDEIEEMQDSDVKKLAKLGDKLSMSLTFSIIFAIVQAIAFAGMLVLLILPLVKPVQIKFASILPIIFSACAIIYSVAILFWTNGLFEDLTKQLGLGDIGAGVVGFEGISVQFSIIGWIYLVLAVGLCVVSILTNAKKKNAEKA